MKKIISLTILFATMLSFMSCSNDNDNAPTPSSSYDPANGQYLIMLYGVGGQNLDSGIAGNILQSLNAGSSNKVKMTYQYRFSKAFQSADSAVAYKNILRFTADQNAGLKDQIDIDKTVNEGYVYETFKNKINATHFGDENFKMSSDTALVSFIKWSKAQYPQATKTILILTDHGGGWSLWDDGQKDKVKTRAIIFDDNTNNESFSLGDVKYAISQAVGKVDVLYTDACLMSTWENLAGYSGIANYFVGSLEPAPGVGGNYDYLVRRLEGTNVDDSGIESAFTGYVDDIVDKWWGTKAKEYYADIAFYNLKKIDEPLNIIKEATIKLNEKMTDTNPLPGVTNADYNGLTWREFIESIMLNTEVATGITSPTISAGSLPDPLVQLLDSLNDNDPTYAGIRIGSGTEAVYAAQVAFGMYQKSYQNYIGTAYERQYHDCFNILASTTTDSYPLSDFLCMLGENAENIGCTDNTFTDIATRYIAALKNFGHVRCTHVASGNKYDYQYQYCSPGVLFCPFDEAIYSNVDKYATQRFLDHIPTAAEALACYNITEFDQKTKWSEFLKLIHDSPNLVTNPSRENVNDILTSFKND